MCTESVKITLFRSFCTSLYNYIYICELWWNYRSESLRKLCVAYNNVFRFLCGEPRNCIVVLVTCLYLEVYLHARC